MYSYIYIEREKERVTERRMERARDAKCHEMTRTLLLIVYGRFCQMSIFSYIEQTRLFNI